MKVKINPVFGIEIECAYNPDTIGSINYDQHHARVGTCTYSNSFYCEYDGSLRTNNEYSQVVEINSVPFQLKQFDRLMKNFKNQTMSRIINSDNKVPFIFKSRKLKSQQIELEEAFNFNPSTGCHIHISPLIESKDKYFINFKGKRFNFKGKPIKIKHLLTMGFLNLFRNRLFKRVKEELPSIFNEFEKYYYRQRFAKKFMNLDEIKDSRYFEFNLTNQDTRLEFRSFHLNGVKTWDDFSTILRIVLEVARDTFEFEINKEKAFYEKKDINLKKSLIDYAYSSKMNEKEIINTENLNEVYIDNEENIVIGNILNSY